MNTSALELPGPRTRRKHSPEFRASIVQACCSPAVSVAAVAMANGLNANMVRRWLQEAGHTPATRRNATSAPASVSHSPAAAAFIPLALPAAPPAPIAASAATADIRIEFQRGASTVKVSWPSACADQCAAWLSEFTGGLGR